MNAPMIWFMVANAGVLFANGVLAGETYRAWRSARDHAADARAYAQTAGSYLGAVQEGSYGRLAGPEDVKDAEFGGPPPPPVFGEWCGCVQMENANGVLAINDRCDKHKNNESGAES